MKKLLIATALAVLTATATGAFASGEVEEAARAQTQPARPDAQVPVKVEAFEVACTNRGKADIVGARVMDCRGSSQLDWDAIRRKAETRELHVTK